MKAQSSSSVVGWEANLFGFFRAELAPTTTRWRDALRLTLLCALATAFIIGFHIPYGEFLVIFFFAVSQPDAWASLRKARLRGVGTLIGGGLAVLVVVAFNDKPALTLVVQALIFAVGLFLSRTTTIPYAVMLAMLTYVIATPTAATDPDGSLEKIFWRILLTLAGAVIGTLAQLLLWPEHPEKLLLQQLAGRLEIAGSTLDRVISGVNDMDLRPVYRENSSIASTIASQLDLLASAEAGSRWLRQRHHEQIKLITDIEMILISVARLEWQACKEPGMMTDSTHARLREIRHQLAEVRIALIERSLPAPRASSTSDKNDSMLDSSTVTELERVLSQMPRSLAFLRTIHTDWRRDKHGMDPIREPIVERTFFTPTCRSSNVEAVRFALKGALAATICYIIYQALNWPGISTCVVTTLICAQSSFGAGLKKSLLRLVGASLGGLATVATVIILLPNLQGAASFIVITSVLFFAASWLTVGSSRVSYIGLQMGLVFSLVLLNQPNQAIDLNTAGDRILGVLLGIAVMGFIDLTIWPNFAGSTLRGKLRETARALAIIPRHISRQNWDEAGAAALAMHIQIAGALALYSEGNLEFGSHQAGREAERIHALTFLNDLEEIFLTLLILLRHRQTFDFNSLPSETQTCLQTMDEAIARQLEALARPPVEFITLPLPLPLSEIVEQLELSCVLAKASAVTQQQFSIYMPLCRELGASLQRIAAYTS